MNTYIIDWRPLMITQQQILKTAIYISMHSHINGMIQAFSSIENGNLSLQNIVNYKKYMHL